MNVTTLSITGSGSSFDLHNNELITTATLSAVSSLIAADQLMSSTTGGVLGSMDFGNGQSEARFTLLGDTNLDGIVNVADLANLAGNFGKTAGQFWINGDLDYNDGVNVADLADLAGNFGKDLTSAGLGAGTGAATTATVTAVATSQSKPPVLAMAVAQPASVIVGPTGSDPAMPAPIAKSIFSDAQLTDAGSKDLSTHRAIMTR
jgi:hypothetical protein